MIDSWPEDARWMRLALAEAARGRGWVEPNPMVGAVIERNGRLIGIGHHSQFGGDHAEVSAIASVTEDPRGATLHVSLEPCCHHGKTPPCVDSILKAGLRRVVVATKDPFPKVSGGGIDRLRKSGIQVDLWPLDSEIGTEALGSNRPFFKKVITGRPYTIAKWAMSLDGRIALPSGDSRWISNERSRRLVHEIRGRCDAVVVGIGTALADDPSLTVRPPGQRVPVRVVIDPRAELPTASRLASTANETPVRIYCSESADFDRRETLTELGCQVVSIAPDPQGSLAPTDVLDHMGASGMTNVLLEGGARTLGRFFDADCIDEVNVFVAPVLFGGPAAFPPIEGRAERLMEKVAHLFNVRKHNTDGDTLITGEILSDWSCRLREILADPIP